MKKIYILLVLALGLSLSAVAQKGNNKSTSDTAAVIKGSSKKLAEKHVEHFKHHLKLSDDQVVKCTEIYTQHFEKAKNIHQEHKDKHHSHAKNEMDPIRQETDAKMKEVLSAEQYEKYMHHIKKMRKGGKHQNH